MEIYNFYPDSEFYRYRHRSCTNCLSRHQCYALKKDWTVKWLDMARSGALCYRGEFEDEQPRVEKIGKPSI